MENLEQCRATDSAVTVGGLWFQTWTWMGPPMHLVGSGRVAFCSQLHDLRWVGSDFRCSSVIVWQMVQSAGLI